MPGGVSIGVCDFPADRPLPLGVFSRARQIPVWTDFIRDLVIALLAVFAPFAVAILRRLAAIEGAGAREDGGHARLREFDLVRGEEIGTTVVLLFRQRPVLAARGGDDRLVQRRQPEAQIKHIGRAAPQVARVEVDVGEGALQREQRVRHVVSRAQVTFFLGRGGDEQDRARRAAGSPRESAGDFQQLRRAGGVVDCAIVDLVTGQRGIPAEMIPGYKHYPLVRIANTSNAMDAILGL